MTTTKEQLSSGNAITASGLAALGNTSAFALTPVDNTSNLFVEAGVQLTVKTGTGTSSSGVVNVYAVGSADGGTTWQEGYTGSAGGITLNAPTNLVLIGIINANADATTFKSKIMSIASAFGYLPGKWAIVVQNMTGATLDATGSNFKCIYEGLQLQNA